MSIEQYTTFCVLFCEKPDEPQDVENGGGLYRQWFAVEKGGMGVVFHGVFHSQMWCMMAGGYTIFGGGPL